MTVRHIDVKNEANGGSIVKIMWNEANSERELTVRMPSVGEDATNGVDVDLLQIPGEEPDTTLDHAISALEDIIGNGEHINIDASDIKDICAGASTTVIRVEGESTDAIEDAFDERLSTTDIKTDAVTGTVISIKSPKDFHLTEAMTVVHGIQSRLTDKTAIVWALNLTDTDTLHVTALLATPRE